MGRRKRQLLDDGDSDSSAHSEAEDFGDENQDIRDERALFENPYQQKRRKQQKRAFGDDSDEEDEDARPSRKRSDWTKAPAFVSSQKVEPDQSMDVDADSDADRAAAKDEDSDEDEGGSQPSTPKSVDTPGGEDDVMEDRPRMGLGASKSVRFSGQGFTKAGIGSRGNSSAKSAFSGFGRGGIGSTFSKGRSTSEQAEGDESGDQKSSFSAFKRGGIGSLSLDNTTTPPSEPHASLPKAFGATRTQRSFIRDDTDSAGSSRSATPNLSAHERVHFNKLEGTFGARMLAKMGWVSGTGLGVSGEGRVNPVETKVRKKGMGIAFGGFSERTAQEKAEARRRGEVVSDDDEDVKPGKGKGKAGVKKEPADAWKRPRKVKTRIEHKTYEEILAETGDSVPTAAGIGPIIDATGATVRISFLIFPQTAHGSFISYVRFPR
jgi:tuftelin-interacting protein 11